MRKTQVSCLFKFIIFTFHISHGLHYSMNQQIRSPLLRAVHHRIQQDQVERNADHSIWYNVDVRNLTQQLCDAFIQFDEDEDTRIFLEQSRQKSDWLFTQLYHTLAKSMLSWFMSQTSINGYLGRGSMFVFSEQQFQTLIGIDEKWKAGSLLDLGAGDGKVTHKMAKHFENIYVTETSSTMKWRLEDLGYNVLGIEDWANGDKVYDVISCLNLLDRCERPITLLKQMRSVVKADTGRVIVAVVIPFKPFVEFGSMDNKPKEFLHIYGQKFEEQVTHLVNDVFEPAGFKLEKFTRLPYLCEGDLEKSYYILDDAVFVLKPT